MADFNLRAIFEFIDKSAAGVKGAEKNIGGLEKITAKAGQALAALGVAGAAKAAYQLAELGAQSLRTKAAFEAISGGADEAALRLNAMRDATRGALSEQEMMASANKLMQMGLADSASELEQVTTMAVRLGTAMGRDAATSIEEFALLLANQSIPRLDTFGISAGRVRERIAELQSETKSMTREAAFLQATMEIGSEAMERLGDDTGDAALSFEQMEASVKDLKAAFGEGLAPAISDVVGAITPVVRTISDVQKKWSQAREDMTAPEKWTQLLPVLHFLDIGIRMVAGGAEEADIAIGEMGPTLAELQASVPQAAESIDDLRITTHLLTDATDGSTAAFRNADAAASGLVGPIEAAADSYDRLTDSVGGLASALGSFDVSAESSWGMLTQLAEQGLLTAEQVKYLAEQQGIATSEQVEATLTQQGLVDAYALGDITITSLNAGLKALARYQSESEAAAKAEAEGQDEAAAAHRNNAEAALGLAGNLLGAAGAADEETAALDRIPDTVTTTLVAQGFDGARAAADSVRDAVNSIPSSRVVTVHVRRVEQIAEAEYQHGTHYARGGLALVGEAGPELVVIPRGSQVIPNNQIHNYTYNRGGDTMIVQDSLSMAALREARYRQEMRERSRMM